MKQIDPPPDLSETHSTARLTLGQSATFPKQVCGENSLHRYLFTLETESSITAHLSLRTRKQGSKNVPFKVRWKIQHLLEDLTSSLTAHRSLRGMIQAFSLERMSKCLMMLNNYHPGELSVQKNLITKPTQGKGFSSPVSALDQNKTSNLGAQNHKLAHETKEEEWLVIG